MRKALAGLSLIAAGLGAVVWSAARSDFRFRGCPEIARSEWPATANCQDGWFAMVAFGGGAAALVLMAVWLLWVSHA